MATVAAAAAKEAPKKTLQLLDPTTLSSAHAVRYPSAKGKVIQGKYRFPNSNAAQTFREQETARFRKALQHLTHGRNIFVYNNLRTNQVVYSLSRNLDRHNVLTQLIYHGKKTVPATVRKDMWLPYFSIHFPSSDIGLNVYRLLREFSQQRQLDPPADMITTSEESLARQRPRDPLEAIKWDRIWKPRIGQIMNKKTRARILMDQKATSIADVSAALEIQEGAAAKKAAEALEKEAKKAAKGLAEGEESTEKAPKPEKKLSPRMKKRQKAAKKEQRRKEEEVRKRIEELEYAMSNKFVDVKISDDDIHDYKLADGEVKILWTDLKDAEYAEKWPKSVVHGELEQHRDHIITNKLKGAGELTSSKTTEEAVVEEKAEGAAPTSAEESKKQEEDAKKSGLDRLKFWNK